MCGIAGIVRFQSRTSEQEVRKMTDSLVHRGPDGEGIWLNETQNVGLGHRRLAIIDLSSKGQQPMLSDDGRYVITFNGEIYNYVELREELKKSGQVFKTENDTEVLIKLFQSKGAECLSDLDGMFAFAVWDNHTNTLFCARDRFGEKPFYYFKDANQFVFASEMKAIWSIGIPRILNTRMAYNYEFFGYQSNPTDLSETFFQNIQALPAGHFLIMKDNKISVKKYYSIELKQEYGHTNADQVAEELKDLMRKSVSRRLRGQVVVGSSFSGGLDSSVIVSEILQILQGRNQNLDVFSAVFPGFEKNEEKFIKKMIEGKKITPHFIMPDQEAYQKIVEKLYYHQEAPFTSSSVIAQYFIYQKAREKNVLVLLDGQGADEVFGGYHGSYHTFFKALYKRNKSEWKKEWQAYQKVNSNNAVNPPINAGRLKQLIAGYFPGFLKMKQKAAFEKSISKERFSFYKAHLKDKYEMRQNFDSLNDELHYQTFTFGLSELLKYADRNSMASGVEIRLPFLDHKIVELLFSLPDEFKFHDGWTKWLLRSTFNEQLPSEICWRTEKIGLEPNKGNSMGMNYRQALTQFQKVNSLI